MSCRPRAGERSPGRRWPDLVIQQQVQQVSSSQRRSGVSQWRSGHPASRTAGSQSLQAPRQFFHIAFLAWLIVGVDESHVFAVEVLYAIIHHIHQGCLLLVLSYSSRECPRWCRMTLDWNRVRSSSWNWVAAHAGRKTWVSLYSPLRLTISPQSPPPPSSSGPGQPAPCSWPHSVLKQGSRQWCRMAWLECTQRQWQQQSFHHSFL